MMTATTTAKKTVTCKRCGQGWLTWEKSSRRGKFYLAEHRLAYGRYPRTRLHICPAESRTLYGTPVTVIDNPRTHQHRYVDWRKSPGSEVTGMYCFGCDDLQVD